MLLKHPCSVSTFSVHCPLTDDQLALRVPVVVSCSYLRYFTNTKLNRIIDVTLIVIICRSDVFSPFIYYFFQQVYCLFGFLYLPSPSYFYRYRRFVPVYNFRNSVFSITSAYCTLGLQSCCRYRSLGFRVLTVQCLSLF
jgi:hypothetical protein